MGYNDNLKLSTRVMVSEEKAIRERKEYPQWKAELENQAGMYHVDEHELLYKRVSYEQYTGSKETVIA